MYVVQDMRPTIILLALALSGCTFTPIGEHLEAFPAVGDDLVGPTTITVRNVSAEDASCLVLVGMNDREEELPAYGSIVLRSVCSATVMVRCVPDGWSPYYPGVEDAPWADEAVWSIPCE